MSDSPARIIVTLDAASDPRAALDTAARLAAHARVPLHGIFVEDEDLLQLARLPFIRHVTAGTESEPLSVAAVAMQLRAAAERARRELAAVAARYGVAWSFEIAPRAAGRVLFAAGDGDLIVAGALSRPIGRHFRVAWRWWSAIERLPGPLLLARHDWQAGGAVLAVIHDRGPGAARLLAAAARLAAAAGGALTVAGPPELAGAEGFAAWLAERISPYPVPLRIAAAADEPGGLERQVAELHCRVLAIEASAGERWEGLRALFARLACDILIVR